MKDKKPSIGDKVISYNENSYKISTYVESKNSDPNYFEVELFDRLTIHRYVTKWMLLPEDK